jgi:hypothetical protein
MRQGNAPLAIGNVIEIGAERGTAEQVDAASGKPAALLSGSGVVALAG